MSFSGGTFGLLNGKLDERTRECSRSGGSCNIVCISNEAGSREPNPGLRPKEEGFRIYNIQNQNIQNFSILNNILGQIQILKMYDVLAGHFPVMC